MSAKIVPRPDDLGRSQRITRQTRAEVARLGQRALVDAASLIARAYVTQAALANVDLVTREEARYVAAHPLTEHRFRAIGEAYAIYAARQASGMGF